ncbi:glycyl-radical enzyme activating protein [Geothermobacter hydrogeniphilus]|uniref:Glycyl-radical enzyme activating protein n=1 Tax=Geothermobacter hydrogeniphilus TaxID=1969733 RepID=A0A2K2HDS8_9BACT|nr:glycyl-radical enzyme activating protein [Geothermobacter hydrogeniphilus]PNU21455.1 glycyl-radical enzyme activating protein [Geothermobacter hydrogeniphilus]
MTESLIFDIKRYAINDGPGIRLTVFFKGCPLACRWCHNPESLSPRAQKLFTAVRCIGCGECVKRCPEQACELTPAGIVTDLERCRVCGACAEICPSTASEISGRAYRVEELLAIIEKERPFFDQSGGGVTFSGGEPLQHPEFLLELLAACGARGIHRTVDTSGLAGREILLKVAEQTELFLYDLKLMDAERHRQWTGVDNGPILANLRALAAAGAEIRIRIPLIRGVNDDPVNIEATARFIDGLPGGPKLVDLLPYHGIAVGKHLKLGQEYPADGMVEPTAEDLERVVARFATYGVTATVGG